MNTLEKLVQVLNAEFAGVYKDEDENETMVAKFELRTEAHYYPEPHVILTVDGEADCDNWAAVLNTDTDEFSELFGFDDTTWQTVEEVVKYLRENVMNLYPRVS